MSQMGRTAEFVCSAITRQTGTKGWFFPRPYTMELRIATSDGSLSLPTRVRSDSPQRIHDNVADIVRVLQQEQEADAAAKDRAQHLRDAAEITRWHLWRKGIQIGKYGFRRGSADKLIF